MRMPYYSEAFYPSDVEVLQKVYDRVCKERGLRVGPESLSF